MTAHTAQFTLPQDSDSTGSRTLKRGLNVLEVIMRAGNSGVRVVDLCRLCALERATVYRLLDTLIHEGYVQSSGRFRYVAGQTMNQWRDELTMTQSGIASHLEPVLRHISAFSNDASFAVVREGMLSSCIARQVGTYPVQILAVQVGTRQPLGVGAGGLALLAALPDKEVEAILSRDDSTLASYGGMNAERLRLLTNATRERGWSVIGNHAARGALAVGVAVRDRQGRPVAAVSVAAPMERMIRQRQELIAAEIKVALATYPGCGL